MKVEGGGGGGGGRRGFFTRRKRKTTTSLGKAVCFGSANESSRVRKIGSWLGLRVSKKRLKLIRRGTGIGGEGWESCAKLGVDFKPVVGKVYRL